ncbi:phage holin family protein [Paracoccus suum]|uniref:Phage holin family protein n=1 Tax=Paracoccus suum TaxID=2259340 RepID=A0A344PLY3_9RHOB|nr:phage holin family protein [Paracoccus suum]AXC50388.1 phage holin family protein [Paracoccus suum]
MFDYARKMQLAVQDMGRRAGLKAGAGVVALLALGFLLAALWTFLARNLGWGPLGASLAIGILFCVIAGVLWATSSTPKHTVPSTDELKREIEARVSLATDVALDKAKAKAREVADLAGNKANELMDQAALKANSFVDGTEAKVQQFTRNAAQNAAEKVGLTPQFFSEAQEMTDRVVHSRAMPAAGVIGAFAVGLTLASKLAGRRRDDAWDDWDGDDWDEDRY